MSTALVLLGHGSHLNADSSAPVYAHAAALRETGRFDQVLEAFWKEEPALRDALDLVDADEVLIVPVFLAEGYFTREVLPRELGIRGSVTRRGSQVVRYYPPVGTHPSMADMILKRAREISGLEREERLEAALVVIGHGTDRSATSGDTVYRLVEQLRERKEYGRVDCGFLDEEPEIGALLDGIQEKNILLIPFFVAEGWHTRETIPHDLALTGEVTRRNGRTIWYAPPVGTLPEMARVVLQITEERRVENSESDLDRPIAMARAAFFEWVGGAEDGRRDFLQVTIRGDGEGRYSLMHVDDAGASERDPGKSAPTPSATARAIALQIVRFTADGRYRPLRTTPDLRAGWQLTGLDADALWEALSILYPATVLHSHQRLNGTLEVVDYRPWAARQTAMYAAVRELEYAEVAEVVSRICSPCLRHRLWQISEDGPLAAEPTGNIVPCREPCTVFATEARDAAANKEACRNDATGTA